MRRARAMRPALRAASAVPLLLFAVSPFLPMWRFYMNAPMFGQRWLEVYVYPLTGVGGEVDQINIANHYVGLGEISNEHIPEIAYMPYVYAAMIAVMAVTTYSFLRGRRKLAVATLLLAAVIFASIPAYVYIWLYNYTHTIHPGAPIKIEPFDPPFIGEHRIANFVVRSFPGESLALQLAAILIGLALLRKVR